MLPVPVVCPLGASCKKPIILRDLLALANAEALEKIKQLAVEHFMIAKRTYAHCVKEGCDQILRLPQNVAPDAKMNLGGASTVHCDECKKDYCFDCSSQLAAAIEAHPKATCRDHQARLNTTVMGRLNYIRNELLVSACPHCKKVRSPASPLPPSSDFLRT